jgi:tetratricopeptide (TPR) repeat protein
MRKIIVFTIIAMLIVGCASSLKQLQRGNYDEAIKKAVKNLRVDPTDQEQIEVLDKAYLLANQQDRDRIKFLKEEGNPYNWDEIFERYSNLKDRQTLVSSVLPLQLGEQVIDYEYFDYDTEIIQAKRNAADYFWSHANELMDKGDKESYRQAYYEFKKAKEYAGNINNINQLIEESHWKGISRVLVSLENRTQLKLPDQFKKDLMTFGVTDFNSEWVEFHINKPNNNIYFDYFTVVNLKKIEVSPEQAPQKDSMESKEIEDGWEYILDDNGNVVKDSEGNDIKIPKKRTISCTLIETHQFKAAKLEGEIDLIQNDPRKVVKQVPIGAESIFEHISARAIGDENALSDESKELLKNSAVPFPHDLDLIIDSMETLKNSIRQGLGDLQRLIK